MKEKSMEGVNATREERLRKGDWLVRDVPLPVARSLVEREHYAKGGSNTRVYTHGLFRNEDIFDDQCAGVAWWIPPTKSSAQKTYPPNWRGVLSLSRLVIIPDTPKNACSFLLSRSMKAIDRVKWPCLVTYADDWRGHTGAIYKACGWDYVGLTDKQPVWVRNGIMVARKAGPKTRTFEEMKALGAELVGSFRKHKFTHIDPA